MKKYSITMTAITNPVLKCIDHFVLLAEREERGTSIIAAQEHRAAAMDIAYLTRDLVAAELSNPQLTKPLIVGGWEKTPSRHETKAYTIKIESGELKVKKQRVYDHEDGERGYGHVSEVPYSQFRQEQENAIGHITLGARFEFPTLGDPKESEEAMAVYSAHFDKMAQCAKKMKKDRSSLDDVSKNAANTANTAKKDATVAVVSYYQQTRNGLWVPEEGIVVGSISYVLGRFGGFTKREESEVLLYPDGSLGVQIEYLENEKWENKVVRVTDFKKCMMQLYRNLGDNEKKIDALARQEIRPVQFENCYENLLRYFTRQFVGVTPANPNAFWLHEGKTTNVWKEI